MNLDNFDLETLYKISTMTSDPLLRRLGNTINEFPEINWTDALSWGQVRSKARCAELLDRFNYSLHNKNVHIHAGWISMFLWVINTRSSIPTCNVISLDLDDDANHAANFLHKPFNSTYTALNHDIMDTSPYEIGFFDDGTECTVPDMIINMSCEHIDIDAYLSQYSKLFNKGKTSFIFQSNNLFNVSDHISCVNNEKEFVDKVLSYGFVYVGSDTLSLDLYDRYTVIAEK